MKPLARLVPYADHIEMSWKNGAGRTREIAREDDDAGLLWRLSLATVTQSGPFSLFPELERIIVLIEGQPMTLQFGDGETLTLETGLPRRFSCDRPLNAVMSGPQECRDLNLLFRRGDVDVQADSMRVSGHFELDWSGVTLVICFAISGIIGVSADDEGSYLVHPGDTFVYENIDTAARSRLSVEATTAPAEFLLFRVSIPQRSRVD